MVCAFPNVSQAKLVVVEMHIAVPASVTRSELNG
jgi:hypothetical protein